MEQNINKFNPFNRINITMNKYILKRDKSKIKNIK